MAIKLAVFVLSSARRDCWLGIAAKIRAVRSGEFPEQVWRHGL